MTAEIEIDGLGVDESGYSEKQLDLDVELPAGQWLDLSDKKKRSTSSLRENINREIKIVNYEIDKILNYSSKELKTILDEEAEAKIAGKLQKLQKQQFWFFRCLLLYEQGQLTKAEVPDTIWQLISR